ncbi:histidine phosphatase, partial [Inquilinus limosus MP06]
MPTRLTLICHGATAATRSGAFPADEPLEDRALLRAAALK